LIINHNKSDLISTLYNDYRYLLQGLDKTTGSFRPHRDTVEETTDVIFLPQTVNL